MAKHKDFTGGISSLLGNTEKKREEPVKNKKGAGRPKTVTEPEVRVTFVMDAKVHEDLEAIAYYDRKTKKETITNAIELLKENKGDKYVEEARKQFKSTKKK